MKISAVEKLTASFICGIARIIRGFPYRRCKTCRVFVAVEPKTEKRLVQAKRHWTRIVRAVVQTKPSHNLSLSLFTLLTRTGAVHMRYRTLLKMPGIELLQMSEPNSYFAIDFDVERCPWRPSCQHRPCRPYK